MNQGMGGYKLCSACNKQTGSDYARTYIDMAKAVTEGTLKLVYNGNIAHFSYTLHPLRFIKQVMSMHLSADHSQGELREVLDSKSLFLNKEAADVPNQVRGYMYLSAPGSTYRFNGIWVGGLAGQSVKISEVSFPPFGFVLSLDGAIKLENMMDITGFFGYGYEEEEEVKFSLPLLKTIGPVTGLYG